MADWTNPVNHPQLLPGEAHVWSAAIPLEGPALEQAFSVLSREERERAGRFKQEGDGPRYISCRGTLRRLLAAYQGRGPADLQFECNEFGKPYLVGGGIHFNVAHCRGMALFAFARDREVGVDVEPLSRKVEARRVANRYFSPGEIAQLASVPDAEYPRAFLNGWTRKEAYIKAVGKGLRIPLDSFEVSLGNPARIQLIAGSKAKADEWTLHNLEPGSEHIGAVAALGEWTLLSYRT
ncbi:MAG: hypothetical protein AMXMBFR84_37310 [Candidatus Hydrogenedentota bacterium]